MSMLPGPYQPLPVTIKETTAPRVDQMAGGVFRFCGFIELPAGAGEWTVPVQFPVVFIEKPSFSFGGELNANSPIMNGNLPTVSGVVANWRTVQRRDTGTRYYTATTIFIVTTGQPDQLLTFHYQFEGKGLLDPAGVPVAPVGPGGVTTGAPT